MITWCLEGVVVLDGGVELLSEESPLGDSSEKEIGISE